MNRQADEGPLEVVGDVMRDRAVAILGALPGRTPGRVAGARNGVFTAYVLHPGMTKSELTLDPRSSVSDEPMMEADELAQVAVLMAALPPGVNMFQAIVLPVTQAYVGRG